MESKYKILKKLMMIVVIFIGIISVSKSVSAFQYDYFALQGNDYLMGDWAKQSAISQIGAVATCNSTNDFRDLVLGYSHIQCMDGASSSAYAGLRLLGVLDINDDKNGRTPAKAKLYYTSSGSYQDSYSANAAQIAYEAYFSKSGSPQAWMQHYYARQMAIISYLTSFGNTGTLYGALNCYWGGGGYYNGMVNYNSAGYAQFAFQLDANGSEGALVKTPGCKVYNDFTNKQVWGINFKKFVVDKFQYSNSYAEAGTDQTFTVTATLKNGQQVTPTVVGGTIKDIVAGRNCTLNVPGMSETNPVIKVKFTTDYYVFKGRLYLMFHANGRDQARIITAGSRVKVHDEVEFDVEPPTITPTPSKPTPSQPTPSKPTPSQPTPSKPTPSKPTPSKPTPSQPTPSQITPTPCERETPFIEILKNDRDGRRMSGVSLTVMIDNALTVGPFITDASKDYDQLIYFESILDVDRKLSTELDTVSLNNAGKLFDKKYQCGSDLRRISVNKSGATNFTRNQIETWLTQQVKSSSEWASWQSAINSCRHHHEPQYDIYSSNPYGNYNWIYAGNNRYYRRCDGHTSACRQAQQNMYNAERAVTNTVNNYPQSTNTFKQWITNQQVQASDLGTSVGGVKTSQFNDMNFPYFKDRIELCEVEDYVREQVTQQLMARVTGSPTYRMWAAHVANCRCSHGAHHGSGCGSHGCHTATDSEGHSYWCCHCCYQHCCNLCPEYQAAMAAAVNAVYEFAAKWPKNTDMLRDWLYAEKFNTSIDGEIKFGTDLHSIPKGEIDPVPFSYSVWDFYIDRRHKDIEILTTDLARVYTGDLEVKITENATVAGYVKWDNANTKTITIHYEGGDVVNGNNNTGQPIRTNIRGVQNTYTYKQDTNDEVEVEHKGVKEEPCDSTYDITKITAYNEPESTEVIELYKHGELSDPNNDVKRDLYAKFKIKMVATEKYWNGQTRVKEWEFEEATEDGRIIVKADRMHEKLGIDVISRWSGTIEVTILKEVETDENYLVWEHEKKVKFTYDWGKPTKIEELSDEEAGKNSNNKEDAITETTYYNNDSSNNKYYMCNQQNKSCTDMKAITYMCGQCKGTGKLPNSNTQCSTCKGTGNIYTCIHGYTDKDPNKYCIHGYKTAHRIDKAKVTIDMYNAPKKGPQIILKKTDLGGRNIEGAVFTAKVEASNGKSVTINNLKTNDAGEVRIDADELKDLKIDVINRWTGTLTVTLKETKAPEGYKPIEEEIRVVIKYEHGVITSVTPQNLTDRVDGTNAYVYYDDDGYGTSSGSANGKARAATITIKNEIKNELKIRKVNGDSDKHDVISGVSFTGTMSPDVDISGTTDANGYIDLTKKIQNLSSYTGDIRIRLRENGRPNGFEQITKELDVTLTYNNGYLVSAKYNNNLTQAVVDVGESENGKTVTVAIKNTKTELQPIYLSKIDSATNVALDNVDFKITVSTSEITNSNDRPENGKMDTKIYKTDDEGLVEIKSETLKGLGLTNSYSGEVYLLIEEMGTPKGYKTLEGPVYVKVNYSNGEVQKAEVISSSTQKHVKCIVESITGNSANKILKVVVGNDWEIPDIVISKETLKDGYTRNLTATFNVSINGTSFCSGKEVEAGKQITIDGAEIEKKLGISGSYSGTLEVKIEETVVVDGTRIEEKLTAKLKLEKGKFVSGTVSSDSGDGKYKDKGTPHLSIEDKNASIILKVLNEPTKPIPIMISGIVWEELATTKQSAVLIDGKYTTAEGSGSEYSDRLFKDIEVMLYQKKNGKLEFVEDLDGTNPTLTDEQGYYEFKGLKDPKNEEGLEGYVVKFTYNGQNFMNTYGGSTSATDKLSSKGSEVTGERSSLNNGFTNITSYPANYPIRNRLFEGDFMKDSDLYEKGYNIAYLYSEIKDVYDNIAIETQKYLNQYKYTRGDDSIRYIYTKVISEHYMNNGNVTDEQIINKLQFIHDSKLDAYAGSYSREKGINSKENAEIYSGENRYVNLGLVARDKTDLDLTKDLVKTIVSINRYDTTYTYETAESSYNQFIYKDDYQYDTNANSNGIAWYQDDQIELYAQYKITVTNTTETKTKLTEVVDYIDYRFGYSNSYTTTKGVTLPGIVVRKGNEVIPTVGVSSRSMYSVGDAALKESQLQGKESKFTPMYIGFAGGGIELVSGGSVDIYVTIKLGNSTTGLSVRGFAIAPQVQKSAKDILSDPEIGIFEGDVHKYINVYNYAEVNSYSTEGGYLDRDSKPGSFAISDFETARDNYSKIYPNRNKDKEAFAKALEKIESIRQDDAWVVKLNVSNNLTDAENAYYRRTLDGSVWEAVNDQIQTSTDLNNTNDLLTWIGNNGIQGIIVELVEVEPGGIQYVRARTVTDAQGNYRFTGYIAGDYSVRFIYGATSRDGYTDDQNRTILSTSHDRATLSTSGYRDTIRGVNGQYYQSTKANPETDLQQAYYWYDYNKGTRYSDAYDEVRSRINQIDATTAGTYNNQGNAKDLTGSKSWNYEWDGVDNVEQRNHLDQIEAYTSTLKLEIEYTKPETLGNQDYGYYRYVIQNVDFGVTPRAVADMGIDKYVSNVKIYMQNNTKQLDVDLASDGSIIRFNNDSIYQNTVRPISNSASFRDGLQEILFDTDKLNGATLEVTYTITVSNNGQRNTITYFYNADTANINGDTYPIALAYYNGHGERLQSLVYYEKDRADMANPIVVHDTANERFNVQNSVTPVDIDVRTRATNIVDYIDPNLNFAQANKAGQQINGDWEFTTTENFNTTRERNTAIMAKYNNFIRAVGGDTYVPYLEYLSRCAKGTIGGSYNARTHQDSEDGRTYYDSLCAPLLPTESARTTLTLTQLLQTTSTETNEYLYSNLIELARIENYAGKITDIHKYDINGRVSTETSHPNPDPTDDPDNPKTLGTSKSETISIHESEGLSIVEEPKSNLGIVLIAVVIFAGGIVLIKKFVIDTKIE